MTVRKPLVFVDNNLIGELPEGDKLPGVLHTTDDESATGVKTFVDGVEIGAPGVVGYVGGGSAPSASSSGLMQYSVESPTIPGFMLPFTMLAQFFTTPGGSPFSGWLSRLYFAPRIVNTGDGGIGGEFVELFWDHGVPDDGMPDIAAPGRRVVVRDDLSAGNIYAGAGTACALVNDGSPDSTIQRAFGSAANTGLPLVSQGASTAPAFAKVSADAVTPYFGEVRMFATTSLPAGWVQCDGEAYSSVDYAGAYAVIGTTFGSDTGDDHLVLFCVPDLRDRFVRGNKLQPGFPPFPSLGSTGGADSFTLTVDDLPAHSHVLGAAAVATTSIELDTQSSGSVSPAGGNSYIGRSSSTGDNAADIFKAAVAGAVIQSGVTTTLSGATDDTGGGSSVDVLPPYATLVFAIYIGEPSA